jgi:hypothetical protein
MEHCTSPLKLSGHAADPLEHSLYPLDAASKPTKPLDIRYCRFSLLIVRRTAQQSFSARSRRPESTGGAPAVERGLVRLEQTTKEGQPPQHSPPISAVPLESSHLLPPHCRRCPPIPYTDTGTTSPHHPCVSIPLFFALLRQLIFGASLQPSALIPCKPIATLTRRYPSPCDPSLACCTSRRNSDRQRWAD